jgi:protein-disulfide isomerase
MTDDGRLTPDVGMQDHAQGSSDAPVTLVEYGDYECPYCGRAYPIVKALQARLGGDLRFVFRNFPLAEVHPNATAFAEFAEAAGAQGKFWVAHDYLFEHQREQAQQKLFDAMASLGLHSDEFERIIGTGAPASRVRADFASGLRSGVNGTPTFFINGEYFGGDWRSEAAFADALMDEAASQRARGAFTAQTHITS